MTKHTPETPILFDAAAKARLSELSALDADGVQLLDIEYAELRDLMSAENAAFLRELGEE